MFFLFLVGERSAMRLIEIRITEGQKGVESSHSSVCCVFSLVLENKSQRQSWKREIERIIGKRELI